MRLISRWLVAGRNEIGYYSGEGENANDMRKALPRDKDKESIIPVPPITPDQLEW